MEDGETCSALQRDPNDARRDSAPGQGGCQRGTDSKLRAPEVRQPKGGTTSLPAAAIVRLGEVAVDDPEPAAVL